MTAAELPPYDSLVTLRADHDALLRDEPAVVGHPEHPEEVDAGYAERVKTFLLRASVTGRYLYPLEERRPIQSMLTYWATFLIRIKERAEGNLLEPFDPEAARARVREARQLGPDAPLNPYQSLAPFGEQDAALFFGRSQMGNEAVARLRNARVLLISGPSGGGKSSLACAGVIPLLKAGAIQGSADWCYPKAFVPGTAPVQALLEAIRTCGITAKDSKSFAAELRRPVVLLIDQFEELFLIGVPEPQREEFIAALRSLAEGDIDHRLVLTMRSDSMEYLERYQTLIDSGVEILPISPMTASELRASIEAPAAMLGVRYESTVVDTLVREFQGESAALPLLQFVLTRLWQVHERSGGEVITEKELHEVGPPGEALGKVAQTCLDDLSADGVKHMRQVMFALLQPGLGQLVHRRRARRKELWEIGASEEIDRLVDRLHREGLVRVISGREAKDDVIEVTHESVLQNWPALQEWIRERREKVPRRLLITESARQWKLTKDNVYLLTGSLLEEAERADDLSNDERELIAQSRRKTTIVRSSYAAYVALLIALFSVLASLRSSQQLNTNRAINEALALERDNIEKETNERKKRLKEFETQAKTLASELKKNETKLKQAKANLAAAEKRVRVLSQVVQKEGSNKYATANTTPESFEEQSTIIQQSAESLARVYIQAPESSRTAAAALKSGLASKQVITPGVEIVGTRPPSQLEMRGREQDFDGPEYKRVATALQSLGVTPVWRKFPPNIEKRALPNRFEIWLPGSLTYEGIH